MEGKNSCLVTEVHEVDTGEKLTELRNQQVGEHPNIGDSDDNNKDSDSSLIANPNGVKVKDIQEGQNEVIIHIDESHTEVKDGGWGWIVVLGCVLLRIIIGGIGRSAPLFYVKFLVRFGGSAAQTAWVTSLGATVRLLVGPIVSVLCNRYPCRKLVFIGAILYIVAIHVSGYATSLTYLYMIYGILGGLGRAFLLTPCTILLSQYFSKKASLAFGLASSGFGLGGFLATPLIEAMFQFYGFNGTFVLLSGIACHLFICVTLFKSPEKYQNDINSKDSTEIEAVDDEVELTNEGNALVSHISSTGSVHLLQRSYIHETDAESFKTSNGETQQKSSIRKIVDRIKTSVKQTSSSNNETKQKWISFSILKDIRFLTLCFATFLFSVPSSGVFLAALAGERGLSDLESAYLLSITAGCDTFIRVASGFVLDLKQVQPYRPLIFNITSFLQGILFFLLPMAETFWQFACLCGFRGLLFGLKAAQRSVVLLDILGVQNLPSSFAYLLTVQGIGTLVGPPVSGFLKDHYGKYDYAFHFGGVAILLGSFVLAYGNLRNWLQKSPERTGS